MTQWRVGLSNGENFTEGVAPFQVIPGELSPWLRLSKYLAENRVTITSLSLIANGRVHHLPSAGKNPTFRAFFLSEKPLFYNFSRPIGGTNGKIEDTFARIEAVYENYILQLWVDEKNPKNSWVLVVTREVRDK